MKGVRIPVSKVVMVCLIMDPVKTVIFNWLLLRSVPSFLEPGIRISHELRKMKFMDIH